MEDYPGPSAKVDLILLANVLPLFPETADKEIRRCLQWLSPGGHVIIILNTMNPILEATGKGTLYIMIQFDSAKGCTFICYLSFSVRSRSY